MSAPRKPRQGMENVTRGFSYEEPVIFERSRPGRVGFALPAQDVPPVAPGDVLPEGTLRADEPLLPEVSEIDVVRHFTRLSTWNAAIDLGLYPLGSCTMKYNPRVNERLASLPGFAQSHPFQPAETFQGFLELAWLLERHLAEISGMDFVSLQPAAGAQGELAGIMMIRAYHEARGEQRKSILVPDSAHGTNPASASLNDYRVITIPTGEDGVLEADAVRKAMTPEVAGLMLTNPNTLGLFESNIADIADIVHHQGGLVYGDGANLNALLGAARPGDLGIDVMHFNLHKTFSTPHGGGGPGSGPVGIKALLEPHLPRPVVTRTTDSGATRYGLDVDRPGSIGRLHGNFGNVGMFVRAYAFIRALGAEGLERCTEMAVLNANYLLARLEKIFHVPYPGRAMHECVLSDRHLANTGVTTLDLAKRLIDYGYHPPTIYFPLVVDGAIMIEPTESESLEGLDQFVEAMLAIEREAHEDPSTVTSAPHTTRHARLDETRAARKPVLRWEPREDGEDPA